MNDDFFVVEEEFFQRAACSPREEGVWADWPSVFMLKNVGLALATTVVFGVAGLATNVSRCEVTPASMTRPMVSPEEVAVREYVQGQRSIDGVAAALGMSATDALFWLDSHAVGRDLKRIRLSPEERRKRLDAISAERTDRQGKPVVDVKLVDREVASSQRIEGIDARPWLPNLED